MGTPNVHVRGERDALFVGVWQSSRVGWGLAAYCVIRTVVQPQHSLAIAPGTQRSVSHGYDSCALGRQAHLHGCSATASGSPNSKVTLRPACARSSTSTTDAAAFAWSKASWMPPSRPITSMNAAPNASRASPEGVLEAQYTTAFKSGTCSTTWQQIVQKAQHTQCMSWALPLASTVQRTAKQSRARGAHDHETHLHRDLLRVWRVEQHTLDRGVRM